MQHMKHRLHHQVNEEPKKKERHIVSWTQEVFLYFYFTASHVMYIYIPWLWIYVLCLLGIFSQELWKLQEDDILREQISIHGTDKY